MILSDKTIKDLNLIKENFEEENLQPASYDLTLDLDNQSGVSKSEQDGLICPINPNEDVLLTTKEVVELPKNIAGKLKDKSSFLRAGLRIGQGFVDPGFKGTLTIPMINLKDHPIWLKNHMTFCQIIFEEVQDSVENAYDGHYQNQRGVTESVLKKDSGFILYGEISD